MKICGIDPATHNTGMSLFVNDKLYDYSLIHLDDKDKEFRLNRMISEIGKQLDIWNPDYVYIEDTRDRSNIDTMKLITNIVGAVRFWCLSHEVEITILLPSEWRKCIGIQRGNTVKRSEYKKMSMEFVKNNFNVDVNDDEADAICIGMSGTLLLNERKY